MKNNNNCDFSNDFLLKGEIYEIHHEANACFYFTYNKKLVCSVKIAVVNSAKAFSGSAKNFVMHACGKFESRSRKKFMLCISLT